ncbi:uncharacterized protein LOC117640268 isoform X3 [Thrips palmi]|nr:uncharacterized protein LOC117640268 isoform X3 [Thrips palmi]
MGQPEFTFLEYVCALAAWERQQPDWLMFHSDLLDFRGEYWMRLQATPGLREAIQLVPTSPLKDVLGQPLDPVHGKQHAADVQRIVILQNYGGIFLDNDVYLLDSLDPLRRFEMSVGWPEGADIGRQVSEGLTNLEGTSCGLVVEPGTWTFAGAGGARGGPFPPRVARVVPRRLRGLAEGLQRGDAAHAGHPARAPRAGAPRARAPGRRQGRPRRAVPAQGPAGLAAAGHAGRAPGRAPHRTARTRRPEARPQLPGELHRGQHLQLQRHRFAAGSGRASQPVPRPMNYHQPISALPFFWCQVD